MHLIVATGSYIARGLQLFAHGWYHRDFREGKDCEGSCSHFTIFLCRGVPWTQLYMICCFNFMQLHLQGFQEDFGTQIFLLTTKVGGLGLTLTKADSVIVVGPAWNPRYPNFLLVL